MSSSLVVPRCSITPEQVSETNCYVHVRVCTHIATYSRYVVCCIAPISCPCQSHVSLFALFQVPIPRFLKRTLFSRRKCTVRMNCFQDIVVLYMHHLFQTLFLSINCHCSCQAALCLHIRCSLWEPSCSLEEVCQQEISWQR